MSSSLYQLRKVLLVSALVSLVADASLAAVQRIPGSVVPGRIQTEVVPLPRPLPASQMHYADFPTSKIDLTFHKNTPHLRKVLLRHQNNLCSAQLENLYRPYLGYPITEKNVRQLADSIAQCYRQRGYFAAQVVVPAQELRQGVLVLVVHEGAALKRFSADLGYDNYNVRWQGPQEYSANIAGNSLLQAGDHTQVNGMISVDGKELRYYAAAHDMPLGYSGTRLLLWANYAKNEPHLKHSCCDFEGKALSGGVVASHPLMLTQAQQLWARFGVRFIDEEMKRHDRRFLDDSDRVALAAVDYDFHDVWQGETQAALSVSHGFNVLGASENHRRLRFPGEVEFTKVNAELSYARPLVDNFSVMIGGEGQYGFDPLLASELMGIGGRYWGRAYDWSEIMGDSGVVGTVELRYDTKPGAPANKNAQYFIAYDAGEVWARHVSHRAHQSLTSLEAGVRLDFTRYLSADLVVAKPLTRDVLANELAGHSGDKIRAFFRVAAHL